MSRIAFRLSNGQTSKTPTGTPVQVAPQLDQLKGATIFRNCTPNCGCEKGKMDNDEDYGGAMDNARTSGKLNEDGSFKDGFDGCVLHMTSQGHSEESAKKICGKIAQEKLGNSMTFGNFDADRLLTNAKVGGKIDNAGNFNGSEEECAVYFRNSGASEVSARCLCKKIAKPGKLSNAQSLENVRRAVQAAVNDDSRFKYTDTAYKGVGPGCWVQDFILGENGAPTKAVIMTQNGLVKVGYTIRDDGTVVLDPGPLEKTEQVYNAKHTGKSYTDIIGCIRNSGTSQGVRKAWEIRHSSAKLTPRSKADVSSRASIKRSEDADGGPQYTGETKQQLHKSASGFHSEAAADVRAAYVAATTRSVPRMHAMNELAKFHDRQSARHAKLAGKFGNSSAAVRRPNIYKHSNSSADIYEQAEKFMNAGKVLPKELNDKLTAKIEEDFPGLIQNAGTKK